MDREKPQITKITDDFILVKMLDKIKPQYFVSNFNAQLVNMIFVIIIHE